MTKVCNENYDESLEYSKQEKRMCSLQFVFINCLSCSLLLAIPFWPICDLLPPVSSRLGLQLLDLIHSLQPVPATRLAYLEGTLENPSRPRLKIPLHTSLRAAPQFPGTVWSPSLLHPVPAPRQMTLEAKMLYMRFPVYPTLVLVLITKMKYALPNAFQF